MTSLVNVTNDYIAGAHRFYTIGSGTSNDNLTNFSIQPKYETVRIQDSNVFVTGSIYPTSCNVYDIGSSNYRWRDLYLSGNTIDLGGTRISRNNDTGGMKISSKVNDTPLDFTAQHITALGTLFASNITIGGNALMIEDNGNVGMGTAIPTQKLDVRGNIYASGNIVCSNISVIGDFVRLDTITSNTEQMVISNNGTGPALKVTQTGANSVAEFYDSESGVALFVGNGGNIGIGTNAPLAKLDVNGNAVIRGNIGIGTTIPQAKLDVNNITTREDYSFPAVYASTNNTWSVNGLPYGNGSYIVTASTEAQAAYQAFNDRNGQDDAWHTNYPIYNNTTGIYTGSQTTEGYNGEWLQIQLPEMIILKSTDVYSRALSHSQGWPQSLRIFGSTNGTNWTQLYDNTNVNFTYPSEIKTYTFNNTIAYNYYRIAVNAVKPGFTWACIGEWRLYGALSNPNVSHCLIDNKKLIIPYTNVGIGTLNPAHKLDVKGYIRSTIPAFSASFTSGSGDSGGDYKSYTTGDKVGFNTTSFNLLNCFEVNGSRFVAPINGLYQFNLNFYVSSGSIQFTFYKNDVPLNIIYGPYTFFGTMSSGAYMAPGSALLQLNRNDFIAVYARSSSSGQIYQGHSHFSGYLVTPL